jgi:hypothetical protein
MEMDRVICLKERTRIVHDTLFASTSLRADGFTTSVSPFAFETLVERRMLVWR